MASEARTRRGPSPSHGLRRGKDSDVHVKLECISPQPPHRPRSAIPGYAFPGYTPLLPGDHDKQAPMGLSRPLRTSARA